MKYFKLVLKGLVGIIIFVLLVFIIDYVRLNVSYLINKDKYIGSFDIQGNTNKYTLLKSNNSKVTDKVLFYASEQAEYKDLKQYLNKYFCYGGKTTTCDTIYYLTTLDATNAKLSAFTYKNGRERICAKFC